jgi:predicted HicB family RNase H-like nuclease
MAAETTKAASVPKTVEVKASVRLPKTLHAKLSAIAKSEGVALTVLLGKAAREYADSYARISQTVTGYTRKKSE